MEEKEQRVSTLLQLQTETVGRLPRPLVKGLNKYEKWHFIMHFIVVCQIGTLS